MRRARDAQTGRFVRTSKKAAEEIIEISKSQYVPYDTRALMNSARVVEVQRPGRVPTHEMTYGNQDAPYALWVHEISKNYNHGRQWKYLETPAKLYGWSERLRDLYQES